jgi:hypothetical protein
MPDGEKVVLIASLTGANLVSEVSVDQWDFLLAALQIQLAACHCGTGVGPCIWLDM